MDADLLDKVMLEQSLLAPGPPRKRSSFAQTTRRERLSVGAPQSAAPAKVNPPKNPDPDNPHQEIV